MSFIAPLFVAAAKAKNWKTAYDECNGCPMYYMLDSMHEIGPQLLADMRAQMAIFNVGGGPNMPRILFAMDVVQTRKIPTPPTDLPADQVANAHAFLASGAGQAISAKKKIRIALFWTENAWPESLSSNLVQKARELLRDNHAPFELDVLQFHTKIPTNAQMLDPKEGGDQDHARELAQAAPYYAPNRLCVIFFRLGKGACDSNIHSCPKVLYGDTPTLPGRPFILINADEAHPDAGTLLHEIGHAAGINDEKDCHNGVPQDDIMSWGTHRTKVSVNLTNHLSRKSTFFVH